MAHKVDLVVFRDATWILVHPLSQAVLQKKVQVVTWTVLHIVDPVQSVFRRVPLVGTAVRIRQDVPDRI